MKFQNKGMNGYWDIDGLTARRHTEDLCGKRKLAYHDLYDSP